jgi:hypothetical protein
MIDDEEFHEIVEMLNSDAKVHSRHTVARDIHDMYGRARSIVAERLQNQKCRLHIALDGWTSPNVISYVSVTVKYINAAGELQGHILDFVKYVHTYAVFCSGNFLSTDTFCRMSKSHTGVNLAHLLTELLESFGIEQKVCGVLH